MDKIWSDIEQLLIHNDRVITNIPGNETRVAIAFCAGLHGNEPSGVLALKNVFDYIEEKKIPVNGRIIAFIGNRNALQKKSRYIEEDLNRMWTKATINKLHGDGFTNNEVTSETREMLEIDALLEEFLRDLNGHERFFVDLHTTSSPTIPFAAIDNLPLSYDFALQLPIPFVSNLDEYLKGTLMHYLDHINFKAIVFEAGTHDDPASIQKHEAIVWLTLGMSGAISKEHIPNYKGCFTHLQGLSEHPHKVFNIIYRHHIENIENFQMLPGFINFQKVDKGTILATENSKPVLSPTTGNIFMPLYQNQGADGFFIIERID